MVDIHTADLSPVRIVNMHTYVPNKYEILIRVDRGKSILGNPYHMKKESDREDVCTKYKTWFAEHITNKSPAIMVELDRIFNLAMFRSVALGCWCYPKTCHAMTIKKYIDDRLKKEGVIPYELS